MTKEELENLERVALTKLHALMSSEVLPVRKEHVEACICVLVFCRDTGTHTKISKKELEILLESYAFAYPEETSISKEQPWKLVPKMKVRCTAQGDPSFGKLGTLVPSGIYDEEVVWAVLIGGVRAWDACKEEQIRRDFEPAVIINGEPDATG